MHPADAEGEKKPSSTHQSIKKSSVTALWRTVEIEVEPGNLGLERGYTKGFIDVVMWAESRQSARDDLSLPGVFSGAIALDTKDANVR